MLYFAALLVFGSFVGFAIADVPDNPCSPPKCDLDKGCRYVPGYPCATCQCPDEDVPQKPCSPPKCDLDKGCRYVPGNPCATCQCPGEGPQNPDVPQKPCSPPKCDIDKGCQYVPGNPCATCQCPDEDVPKLPCSPPKCDIEIGCRYVPGYPCGKCKCPDKIRKRRNVQCSMPACQWPCKIVHLSGSCPYCDCQSQSQSNIPQIQCSPPKCDGAGCYIDSSTKPCPSCVCTQPSTVQCDTSRCEDGCILDYNTQPCPSCECNNPSSVQCSTPNCNPGCSVDYSTKPCATCKCGNAQPSQGFVAVASAHTNSERGYYGR